MPRPFRDDERAAIRERLLALGRTAAARGDFRRTPVEQLAASAGISKGAFYQFFAGKEALLLTLLQEVEAALRAQLSAALDGPDPLRRVITLLFEAVVDHPMLGALRDPEELAWLVRQLPAGALDAARADDDRFFGTLLAALKRAGEVDPGLDAQAFAGLAPAALALAQQRALIGPDRADAVTALVIDGLVARLSPPSPRPRDAPGTRRPT